MLKIESSVKDGSCGIKMDGSFLDIMRELAMAIDAIISAFRRDGDSEDEELFKSVFRNSDFMDAVLENDKDHDDGRFLLRISYLVTKEKIIQDAKKDGSDTREEIEYLDDLVAAVLKKKHNERGE